ncbi:MAG: hypothetical protein CMD46_01235 [Gammaproteobacteria bacterium]|nr:hypothetical protein [Gammaproteobacteria bacterium]|tara:strand:+ start:678 stop:1070 length:393 start_codon:yes stop_codon:yes gene_type:complete
MSKESIFLIFTALGLVPLGISYGTHPYFSISPISFLKEIEINSTDLANIFSAIMGLYISMAIFWIVGAFKKSITIHALWSLLIFMTGIGLGRAISMLTDGMPTAPYQFFLLLEIVFALVAYKLIKGYKLN